jgi:hypothetical protein
MCPLSNTTVRKSLKTYRAWQFDCAAEMAFPDLPFAEALGAVANDHFRFVTAESEPGIKGMEARFAALEQQMAQLLRQSSKDVTSSPGDAARPKRRAAPIAAPDLPPGLDPGVAQQALQAGVSRQALNFTFEEEEDDFADLADASVSGGADPVSTAVCRCQKF